MREVRRGETLAKSGKVEIEIDGQEPILCRQRLQNGGISQAEA